MSDALTKAGPSLVGRARGRFLRNTTAVVAVVFLLGVLLTAVFADLLVPHDPYLVDLDKVYQSPSLTHPFGTDGVGRDVLSRLMVGARISLLAGAIASLTALLVGVPTGLVAGYYGRVPDAVFSWLANLTMVVPAIIIILIVIGSFGSSVWVTMTTMGLFIAPAVYRLTRGLVITVKNELYVDAARVAGLSDLRIIFRHIVSVVRGPLMVQFALISGAAIIIQSGLDFLGFGDPRVVSWGGMLSSAFGAIFRAPGAVYAPGLTIGVTVAALALAGTALADILSENTAAPTSKDAAADRAAAEEQARLGRQSGVSLADRRLAPPTDAGSVVAAVEDLRVSYPSGDGGLTTVVDGVHFHVRRGEVLGIVGESGSGKTQSLFALLGLLPPTAQATATSMSIAGVDLRPQDPAEVSRLRGGVMAYVPQEPMANLDPAFTVGHQLVRPLLAKEGLGRSAAKSRALELLDRVGIVDPPKTFASYPHQISGGMAQRVLIAGAISCSPQLLLADEPTTALDVSIQAEILGLLRQLQREENMGMILVTHNFGVVADICDVVAVMERGKIVEIKPSLELFRAPEHPYTRTLLDAVLEDAPLRRPVRHIEGSI